MTFEIAQNEALLVLLLLAIVLSAQRISVAGSWVGGLFDARSEKSRRAGDDPG